MFRNFIKMQNSFTSSLAALNLGHSIHVLSFYMSNDDNITQTRLTGECKI